MPSWKTPTDQQIDTALLRMRSPEFEAYFFSRLENPLWILPLRDKGVFESPPPPVHVKGGGTSFPTWPASQYLARMAKHAPNEVAAILLKVETDNPAVIADLVEAGLAMPASLGATLVPAIARSAGAGAITFHIMEAAALCVRIAEGDELDSALALAEALFRPVLDCGKHGRDAYWHREALEKVVPTLAMLKPEAFLVQMCKWLEIAIEARDHCDSQSGEDYSYFWRQAIEEHGQNNDFDFAGDLVGFVRQGFEVALREVSMSLGEALGILETFGFLVFDRMRIHLIDEFAELDQQLAKEVMMDRHLFDDHRYKHEYANLVGHRFPLLAVEERETWLGWVREGPAVSEEEDVQSEEIRQGQIDYWRFCRLHWVRDHLCGLDRDFYQDMLETHGEPTLADLHTYTSAGAWGSVSPMSVEDLAAGSFADAVDVVAAWRPHDTSFRAPDLEGLAFTFQAYVGSSPEDFSENASLLIDRPAIYVRGFLNQMTEAIKEGQDVSLDPVLTLSEWVVSRPSDERTTPIGDRDTLIDSDWQWTRDQISRLVEEICKAKGDDGPRYPTEGLRQRIWSLISELCSDPSPSYVLQEEAEEDPRSKDYLTLSINSPRGKAAKAALEYSRWVASHVKTVQDGVEVIPGGFETMPEVREMLDWQLDFENRSVEALAIIGLHLGLIFWIDEEWLAQRAEKLFDLRGLEASPPRSEGWAAWNAFLVWVKPHIEFFKLFEDSFSYAIETASPLESEPASRENPIHHLGEHLLILYGRGQISLSEEGGILRRFLEVAHPRVRRHAIGFIGRILWRETELPTDTVERFMRLWEAYWAGPGKQDGRQQPEDWLFGVWFASSQLPEQWALEQLAEFVETVPIPEPDHAVVDRLAEIAPTDLRRAVDILDKMVHGDLDGWHVYMWRDSARKILALAMEAGGSAKGQAERTIDALGRRGYPEFGELA